MNLKLSLPNITLAHGDNIEYSKSILDDSVQLTVTSPPYDNLRDYTDEFSWDNTKFEVLATELYRLTKPGGVVVWNVADQTTNGSESGSSFKQVLYFMSVGFLLADTMIYKKDNPGGARGSNKTYIQCFEYMFVLSKGPLTTFNLLKDRPNKNPGRVSKGGGGRKRDGTLKTTKMHEESEFGRRFNIWNYATRTDEFSSQHPAPFPYELAQDHILSWSNIGDTVYDPFGGSGTTAVAALMNDRKSLSVDISEEYVDLAATRIEAAIKEKENLKLFGF